MSPAGNRGLTAAQVEALESCLECLPTDDGPYEEDETEQPTEETGEDQSPFLMGNSFAPSAAPDLRERSTPQEEVGSEAGRDLPRRVKRDDGASPHGGTVNHESPSTAFERALALKDRPSRPVLQTTASS